MKKYYRSFSIFFLCLLSVGAWAQSPAASAKMQEKLDLAVSQTLEQYKMPGLSAILIDQGKVYLSVKGKRKRGAEAELQLTDHLHLGSNTKAMTGFLAARLVEEGKIKWDTRVLDIFPAWKTTAKAAYHEITLQDLLSHRARIHPFTTGLEFMIIPTYEGTNVEKRKSFSQWLLGLEPVALEPSGYTYSNAGYTLASTMLEAVTGEAWESLLARYLFTPLGIEVSYGWPARQDTTQVWGHLNGAPHDPNGDYHLGVLVAPAGDVSMSTQDYAKFLQQQLKGLAGEDDLLPAKTLQFLHQANTGTTDYGIGWGRSTQAGKLMSYHDGSAGTFYCHALLFRAEGKALAVLSNAADQQTIQGIYDLSKKLQAMLK